MVVPQAIIRFRLGFSLTNQLLGYPHDYGTPHLVMTSDGFCLVAMSGGSSHCKLRSSLYDFTIIYD